MKKTGNRKRHKNPQKEVCAKSDYVIKFDFNYLPKPFEDKTPHSLSKSH